jgi:hypothetical protein
LFCFFLAPNKLFRIDVFEADKDAGNAGAARFGDEVREPVAHGVDLDYELDVEFLLLAHRDQAVKNLSPVGVAGEIVVGDEDAIDALGEVAPDDLLHVVGRAPTRFASLHIDDGAERALERAAAPGIEGADLAASALDARGRENRHGHAVERGQVRHVVVQWRERALPGVAQDLFQAALGLAGKQRDAKIHGLFELGCQLGQHGQATRDMEA